MQKPTVVITGATGLIGTRLCTLLADKYHFVPVRFEDGVDITRATSLTHALQGISCAYVLHLAAYTNVDKAEQEREKCYAINVLGTRNMLSYAQSCGARFAMLSTDFVLKADTKDPKTETSPVEPLGYYARTKYEAEQCVANDGLIIRITTPYGQPFVGKKDIVQTIKTLLAAGMPLKMINDNLVVPTYIDDIVEVVHTLLQRNTFGIFHAVGPRAYSMYDVAQLIARRWKYDTTAIGHTTHAIYGVGKAPRPQYGNIVSTKSLGVTMKDLSEGIALIS